MYNVVPNLLLGLRSALLSIDVSKVRFVRPIQAGVSLRPFRGRVCPGELAGI